MKFSRLSVCTRALARSVTGLLLAFSASLPIAAQETSVVTGSVVSAEGGIGLAGAEVRISSLGRLTVTGSNGRFMLTGIPAGQHDVSVTYMGYATQTLAITISGGRTGVLSFELQPSAIAVDGITITGQREGQARALNQQRTAANITNVVAADQIGRFPDANIGDAMKRIPGINVMVDQGEARFGLIRGTEPRLNSVTLNGERIPSAEAETREVQLDLIPADMVAAVEVTKAVTPDMDADAIGGSVNIVTREAPHGRRISTTLGSGFNFLAEQPMGLGSIVLADRFAGGRLGMVLSGSYFNHQLGSDNIEAEWSQDGGTPFIEEFDVRRYDIQRVRRSVAASFDYRLSDVSTLTLRSMYNHRDDWENRYRLRYRLDEPDVNGIQETEIRRQTKGGIDDGRTRNTRLEDQRVQSHSLSGEHLLNGRVRANWSAGFAQASENRPDERYIEWRARRVDVLADLSNPRKPSFSPLNSADVAPDQFTFRRIEDENQFTRERDYTGRLDFLVPLRDRSNSIKVGARIRQKEKLRDNDFIRAIPVGGGFGNLTMTETGDFSDANYLAGNYPVGVFTRREFLGRLDFNDPSQFTRQDRPDEYAAGNFDAEERVTAGYAMLDQKLGARTSLLAGVRVENTDISYNGFEFNEDTDAISATAGVDNYTNVMPGLHVRHEMGPNTIVRFAWTNTIARPNYFDLVPYRIVSFDDNTLEVGNPDLNPTTSMNLDLMAEHYFQSVGLISGGMFFKDVSDFIFNYTLRNVTDPVSGQLFNQLTRPENGSAAELYGFEFAFQRQLDFLPGALAGLGVYTNYTFTDSRVRGLNVEGRESEKLALPGTARHSGNLSLSYDTRLLSVRGSANFADAFMDPGALGSSAFFDRYYDGATNVDLNASVTVTPQLRVFAEANNLTNQPLRYYQGVRERMMQEEFYNRRFTMGLKYDM